MKTYIRKVDSKGRLFLSKAFANATVIIEHISDTELRIRLAPTTHPGNRNLPVGKCID
jgi:hypothetical protein